MIRLIENRAIFRLRIIPGCRCVNGVSPVSAILILSLFLTAIFFPLSASAEEIRHTVAVLSFRVQGLEETAGEALSHVVRHEVMENKRITLVDRDRTEAILMKLGLVQAGACNDVGCMVQAGRLLGVERVVTGSINRLGSKYLIELRAANVTTGTIEALETGEHTGRIEDLTDPVREIAQHLMARLTNRSGVIMVDTRPGESSVKVDGVAVGLAPVRIERPGGVKYRIEAERIGHKAARRKVFLSEDDSLGITLSLPRISERSKHPPLARIWLSGGIPLNQNSATIDTRISWGKGTSYGASADFGDLWRLRFGGYSYSGILRDVEESALNSFTASGDPRAGANVYYSTLIYSTSPHNVGAVIGGGVAALTREITIERQDGSSVSRRSDLELGLAFEIGAEVSIFKYLATQIEILHVLAMNDQRNWNQDDETLHVVWDKSFHAFESFTVMWFSVGYRF